MIPKVGDIVRLNPDFLKVWFRRGNKYLKEDWKEKYTITKIDNYVKDEFIVRFESKNKILYRLFILSNGELNSSNWCNEYEGMQVFLSNN